MKKILLYSALFISAMLTISSCIKDSTVENTTTEDKNGGVKLAVTLSDQTTRAIDEEALLQTTNIKIYKPLYEGLIREYNYADLPKIIYLPATTGSDKYRVEVTAGERTKDEPAIASWDSKSYKGSAEFAVKAGEVSSTPIEVEANISNVITEVTFDNGPDGTISKFFETGYQLTIGYGGNNLVYTAEKNGAEGYFIFPDGAFEPELEWEFTGKFQKNNEAFSQTGKFSVVPSKKYKMNLVFNETEGTITFTISVNDQTTDFDDEIEFEPTSTGIENPKTADIWAKHFNVRANVDITTYDKTKVYFEYRKKNDTNWTRTSLATEVEDGLFSHTFTGLTPETEYEYRLIITPLVTDGSTATEEVLDAPKTFTTSAAPTIPNAGLEQTSNAESLKYPSFYAEGEDPWWGSGNAGSGDFGYKICDVDINDKKEGNKSALLQSAYAVVKFAAGNLFSGKFGQVLGTDGGTVYFGRPFVGRPTAIRFWVKGAPAQVTDQGKGDHLSKGDYDTNQIKVALGTWTPAKYGGNDESPILINTTKTTTFVDFNTDTATIAYGDLQITTDGTTNSATINGEAATEDWNDWVQVTLPLEYRDLKTLPTHIVISCAASMYGDYFEGSVNSKMWVDAFELIYDENVVTK